MSRSTTSADTQAAIETLQDVARAGVNVFGQLTRTMIELGQQSFAANPLLQAIANPKRNNCCSVPEPCWMPRALGDLRTVGCPGSTATIVVRITNGIPQVSKVGVSFGQSDITPAVAPQNATLGPMERQRFVVTLAIPSEASRGQRFESLVWVRGCRDYYLRWTVDVADNGTCSSCHEIEVEDSIDTVHHWYDHFYCDRPCAHPIAVDVVVDREVTTVTR